MLELTAAQQEVDANLEAFQDLLPELIENEAERWALMRHRECVAFYDTFRDATIAGNAQFEGGLFSVQEITGEAVDF